MDGGCNYVYDLQQLSNKNSHKLITNDEAENQYILKNPNLLTGDFDSIRDEVLTHFKAISEVKVIETPDQNNTDFTKAVNVLRDYLEQIHSLGETNSKCSVKSIVVFYTSAGRLDHVLSIFSTLYKFSKDMYTGEIPQLILFDLANSISFILTKVSSFLARIIALANNNVPTNNDII